MFEKWIILKPIGFETAGRLLAYAPIGVLTVERFYLKQMKVFLIFFTDNCMKKDNQNI